MDISARMASMEPVVLLGTRSNGITLLDVQRAGSAPAHEALVEVTSDGLSASTWVYEYPDFQRLIDYFRGIELDWRGWNGVREWASLEGQLAITAQHTGAHIELAVKLQRSLDWRAETEFSVGAGEDVSSAVRALEGVLA